jgi:C-terminal processing protease CtpA/Prc
VEFDQLLDTLNESYQFDLIKQRQGRGPSDHTSFYRRGVPVLFLFTGLHADYHRPTDDSDKINLDGLVQVTDFVGDIVDRWDDVPQRPTFQQTTGLPRFRMRPSGPYLGVMPDVGWQGDGCAIMSVVPASPAAAAGLRAGDVIVQLGDKKIGGRRELAQVIGRSEVGEPVPLRVLRGGEEVTLSVILRTTR